MGAVTRLVCQTSPITMLNMSREKSRFLSKPGSKLKIQFAVTGSYYPEMPEMLFDGIICPVSSFESMGSIQHKPATAAGVLR